MMKAHLIAACGVGMGSLAGMLQEKGFRVTGSDVNIYPPMSTQLENLGISLFSSYAAENIPKDTNLVVVGNAISRGNPETEEAIRRGLPLFSMPQVLAEYFIKNLASIVVAGTHGKTTASSLCAWSLFALGDDPSFFIGGVPRNFTASYRVGNGSRFVVEGDEYDSAYFDKGPKFFHYRPKVVLLTSIEFDHADMYKDIFQVRESFGKLVRTIPPDGLLVACSDYPDVVKAASEARCPVAYYSTTADAPENSNARETWSVRVIAESAGMTSFRMGRGGRSYGFRFPLPGLHNASNAAGVALLLMRIGYPFSRIADAFELFEGVRRRQEVLGEFRGILLVDDFAHHPTAVRETIRAMRGRHADRRIVAVFEPRSNTSRRKLFQREFTEALAEADSVIIAGVYNADKIPQEERLSPEELAADLRQMGCSAESIQEVEDIVSHIDKSCGKGDLVLLMSNGGFGGIREKLVEALSS